jgi:hypothetical protein
VHEPAERRQAHAEPGGGDNSFQEPLFACAGQITGQHVTYDDQSMRHRQTPRDPGIGSDRRFRARPVKSGRT